MFLRALKRIVRWSPSYRWALVWRLLDYKVAIDCHCTCGAMGRWLAEKRGE